MAWNRQRRVLVVDDDPSIIETFGAILRSEGYEVLTASSGRDAVALARQEPVDLILLDLVMPGMDGLAALPQLREARPTAPVVILCADVEPDGEVEAFGSGAVAVLLKPPDVDKLLRMVEELTGRRDESRPDR
jgi:two-component system nitrogen regulation response regulator NtrX